jgi:primosomal protein N' (replication factor Y)
MAALDGTAPAVHALLDDTRLPEEAEVLGPVELPPGVRRPAGAGEDDEVIRMLVRVGRTEGLPMAVALRRAAGIRSAKKDQEPVRMQIDPLHFG